MTDIILGLKPWSSHHYYLYGKRKVISQSTGYTCSKKTWSPTNYPIHMHAHFESFLAVREWMWLSKLSMLLICLKYLFAFVRGHRNILAWVRYLPLMEFILIINYYNTALFFMAMHDFSSIKHWKALKS